MKAVSDEFKAAAIAPVKVVGGTVTVVDSGSESASYTENDMLQSISFESYGELFGSVATTVTVKLLGTDYDLIGKTINIRYSLVVENDIESIDYGIFTVTEQPESKNKESTTIKAVSQMMNLQNTPYSTIEGFPMTVEDMAQEIANRFSLTLSDMSNLPNYDYTIQQELYSNITGENYRNILAEIAGTTGTMAVINNSASTLTFRPYQSVVQQALDYQYLKSYTIGEHYGPINTLVLSRLPQEDNIAVRDESMVTQDGPKEVKLANNEIMDDEREAVIEPLFDAIKGIEWTAFEITTVGLGWLECGDRISITDDDNNTIEGIITNINFTYDGGVKETIKGILPKTTATNYALAGGTLKTIYNTEIKVDKQGQEIQSIVSEQTAFENQTTENFTNITQNISSVITSVQNSGGNNLIKNSAFFASDDSGRFFDWEMGTESTILPPEYQQVEYLESTGTQWIDTNIVAREGYSARCEFQITQFDNDYQRIIGSTDNDGSWMTWRCGIENNGSWTDTDVWEYSQNSDIYAKTNAYSEFCPYDMYTSMAIFGQNESDDVRWVPKAKIFSCQIIDSVNNLAGDFVPCYRISDGVKGMFDTISRTLFTNDGIGEFLAGQAVGIPIVYPSAEVAAHGSLSGQVISLAGVIISQAISVKVDDSSITEENKTYYSFSCRCKKNLAGTASVTITDGTDEGVWTIDFPNGTDADWEEFNIDKMLPKSSELRITATGSSDSDFQITDMMLAVGDYHSQWQQASGESNNTQVSITTDGITVKNGNLATSWSRHNNQGFNAYKDRQLTASLNADEVIAPKAEFSKEIDMPPIKIVPQSDGWAFVSTIS